MIEEEEKPKPIGGGGGGAPRPPIEPTPTFPEQPTGE